MTVGDFRHQRRGRRRPPSPTPGAASARASWRAVEATRAACGQNTNLGIVLLAAPLAAAAEAAGAAGGRARGHARGRSPSRTRRSPTGRSVWPRPRPRRSGQHDVREEPEVTLLAAMRAAADRDRIARQYATGFEDVFDIGVAQAGACRAAGWSEAWATSAAFLAFLAAFPDTHVVAQARRRGGRGCAAAPLASSRCSRDGRRAGLDRAVAARLRPRS